MSEIFNEISTAGQIVNGRYEICERLGGGGMGVVVLAKDRADNENLLAIKFLRPELAAEQRPLARFKQELEISQSLVHPNIVRLYQFATSEAGLPFITMEYIDGVNLASLIESRGALPVEESCLYISAICSALHYAHQAGIVHRDLKPDNVLLGKDGTIKLTDFGLARLIEIERGLTPTGEAIGTPYYMAPEQLRGEKTDARSDIYSLGIMIFQLLTGTRPFQSDVYVNLATMHLTQKLPQARSIEPSLPSWADRLIEECCEKEPRDRFQSISELARSLQGRVTGEAASVLAQISGKQQNLFSRLFQKLTSKG